MTTTERIENLERRVRELEARKPVIHRGEPIKTTYGKKIVVSKTGKKNAGAMPSGGGVADESKL